VLPLPARAEAPAPEPSSSARASAAARFEPPAAAGDPRAEAAARAAARSAALDALDRASEGAATTAALRAVEAFTDPDGDTVLVRVEADGTATDGGPVDAPEADLTAYAVDYGATETTFSAQVAQPVPIQGDQGWLEGRNSVSWTVSSDQRTPVGVATLTAVGGVAAAVFARVEGDQVLFCDGAGGQDMATGALVAARFPSGCVGGTAPIFTAASTAFQVGPLDGETVELVVDVAPDAGTDGPAVFDGPIAPDSDTGVRVAHRLAGADRLGTSVEISAYRNPSGAPVAYLATAAVFADALAAGSLPGGPTLLVPPCGPLPLDVRDELERLRPAAVIALGGIEALCKDVLDAAQAATGTPLTQQARLFGPTASTPPWRSRVPRSRSRSPAPAPSSSPMRRTSPTP